MGRYEDGMVMLIGPVGKAAILIVELAKMCRDAGLSVAEAVGTAALSAVTMTPLSFFLCVLPLVFASGAGAASRTSIGCVALNGMVAETNPPRRVGDASASAEAMVMACPRTSRPGS